MSKSKYIDDQTIHDILKPYAYKVFKDLSNESHRVIDEFYSNYDPKYYKRTYGMKNLFTPEMIKLEDGYLIRFSYDADFLTTEHRSNEDVFDGSFVHGWHGGKYAWGHLKEDTPRMKPSPWDTLRTYVRTYKL